MRRLAASALLIVACAVEEGPPLSRLAEAWAEEAVTRAAPMTTATLVLASMSAELCLDRATGQWAALSLGDVPPLAQSLVLALGSPVVRTIKVTESGLVEATIEGVDLAEREQVRLQIATSQDDAGDFNASIIVLDPEGHDDSAMEPDAFGRTSFRVQSGCTVEEARVTGTARWLDLSDRSHTVDLPADSELTAGVRFERAVSYAPSSGTLAWTGRIDGQEVGLTTVDAEQLQFESAEDTADLSRTPTAVWGVYVRGDEWTVTTELPVSPDA